MPPNELPLAEGETLLREIPPSKKTVAYYSLKAAPLFGVWFVGLLVFLIYSFRVNPGKFTTFLFQAIALSGLAYLVGVIARWLWRVDVSQRDAWLSTHGIWFSHPGGTTFVQYGWVSTIRIKNDWMQKWLHVFEIEIKYTEKQTPKKMVLVGVENPEEIVGEIHTQMEKNYPTVSVIPNLKEQPSMSNPSFLQR